MVCLNLGYKTSTGNPYVNVQRNDVQLTACTLQYCYYNQRFTM